MANVYAALRREDTLCLGVGVLFRDNKIYPAFD